MEDTNAPSIVELTSLVVANYVSNNRVASADLSVLISTVHSSLVSLGEGAPPVADENQKPAVPIRKSIHPEYLVCLEDGTKLKMLKRYLRTRFQMTPQEYRSKWNLPADYPMVAPLYAEARSNLAKAAGLGRSRPARSTRKSAAESETAE